jgi:four helix bundle protein
MNEKLHQLWIVQLAEKLGHRVSQIVKGWPYFDKNNIGQQLVRSADSIGANIVEGQGRHHARDSLRFFYFARASLEETIFWIRRGIERELISETDGGNILSQYFMLSKSLDSFIRFHQSRQ